MKFFVPWADSPEQAEKVYAAFVANSATYPLSHPTARIRSATFTHRNREYRAEVGKEIAGFPEHAGPVLAIVGTTQLVCIHTQLRGGLSASPILASTASVTELLYFDDFPARP